MTVAVDLPPVQPAPQEQVQTTEEVALNEFLNDRITVEEETSYTASKLARVILCLIFIGIFSLIFCGTASGSHVLAGIVFHFLILFIGYLGAVKRCSCFLMTYAIIKIVLLTLLILAIFHVIVSLIVVSFREEKYCRESHCSKKEVEMSELTILQVGLWLIIIIIPATLSFCSVVLALRLRRLVLLGKALQAHDEEALYPADNHHHHNHHHHAALSPVDNHHHHNHHHHAAPSPVDNHHHHNHHHHAASPVDNHHHHNHHHHAAPTPVDSHHHHNHHHHTEPQLVPAPVDGHHHTSHHHHHAGMQFQPIYYVPVQQPGEQGQSLTPTFYYPQFIPQVPPPNAPPAEE